MNEIIKQQNYNRKCIATNQITNISNLLRIDYDKKNNLICVDYEKVLKGRGCYFILNIENWEKIKKNKLLNRSFRTNISKEIYEEMDIKIKEFIYGKKKS
ncbi:YlxR family protein [Mycoplasmopsis felis]|uniref:YlxR domain-containing protein n=1 Tax=Mycoplasmopsis felis TaxID=33923 RepID=A0A809SI80_9BACT|nr:YlxR family protein [Mycoplasmopsis felis]WQQ04300.1 YlxR family protein [Mycoplasmopsis felis]WQQ07258.1 YlxR family protein [Mycoplasmopsis felis]WQQ07774.1 YlxR family protein [Mycoplasmopsis felis]WQQ08301.1 YlxR family protein [Mycoplasmopsis felis]WQQ10295.1 YlxR family protein [Mycoplasmopsis felis]